MPFFTMLLLLCCSDKESSVNDDTAPAPDTDTSPQDTGPDLPDPPDNFTISTSGEMTEDLSFDTPTCTLTNGAPNFYAFWRTSQSHVFVLKVELRGIYTGAGSYTGEQGLVVKLQEEAGGSGRFFQSDAIQDSIALTLEISEEEYIFGEVSVPNLYSSSGAIALSPTTFPIWCSPENTN